MLNYPMNETVLPDHTDAASAWQSRASTRLMHAVLEQAVRDLLRYRDAQCRVPRTIYRDAYRWVLSSDRSHPFSFVNLCEALGYWAPAVRRNLLGGEFAAPPRRSSNH